MTNLPSGDSSSAGVPTGSGGVGLTKTIEQHFADWEGDLFGFGYGSGEPHIIPALKKFFALCPQPDAEYRAYEYEVLERELGATVAWFIINAMGQGDVIEYGSSPRYAWLTKGGYALKAYFDSHTEDELLEIVCRRGEDDYPCYRDVCNCGPSGHQPGVKCDNPFWDSRG